MFIRERSSFASAGSNEAAKKASFSFFSSDDWQEIKKAERIYGCSSEKNTGSSRVTALKKVSFKFTKITRVSFLGKNTSV